MKSAQQVAKAAALALLLCAPGTVAAGSLRSEGSRGVVALNPEPKPHHETGEPQHDEVFYKEDYPHDHQPKAARNLKFPAPYPEVQDEDTFDADYTRDENGDSGEWKAQMDYDNARNLLHTRRINALKAKKVRDNAAKALEEMRNFHDTYASRETAEEIRYRRAKSALDQAQAEVDRLTHVRGAGHKDDPELDAAVDAVAKAAEHLDGCEEELERAREAAESLLQAADEEDKKRLIEALRKSHEAVSKYGQLNATLETGSKSEIARVHAQHNVEEQQKAYDEAHKRYEDAVAARKAAQAELRRTGDHLRKYRKVPEPQDGLLDDDIVFKEDAADDEDEEHHDHHAQSGAARPAFLASALLAPFLAAFMA